MADFGRFINANYSRFGTSSHSLLNISFNSLVYYRKFTFEY